jgi:hypothetical protein
MAARTVAPPKELVVLRLQRAPEQMTALTILTLLPVLSEAFLVFLQAVTSSVAPLLVAVWPVVLYLPWLAAGRGLRRASGS